MNKIRVVVLLATFSLFSSEVNAQCSMCRRIAESNMEAGEVRGKGLNTGILYLMSVPYLMAGVAGFMWWKRKQAAEKETAAQD
jgi:hypothetical protein